MSYAAARRTPQTPLTSEHGAADRGSLSKSELLVLRLICIDGMTHEQVAKLRYRTLGTSQKQLHKAKRKLGAKNAYQLGYMAGQIFATKETS